MLFLVIFTGKVCGRFVSFLENAPRKQVGEDRGRFYIKQSREKERLGGGDQVVLILILCSYSNTADQC